MERDIEFLSKVFALLDRENVFRPTVDDRITDFRQPDELQKIIDFTIDNEEPLPNDDLERLVHLCAKHSNKSNHPYYVTEMFGGYDLFALAGSWIADALNTTQFTYEASPIFTMTDNYVIKRFLKQLGWSNGDGAFTAGGSMANMYAMVYARSKVYPDMKENGMYGRQTLVVFTSEDSHFSMEKSAALLGLGTTNIVSVKADANGKMKTDALERAIVQTIAEGKKPFFVNATAGTTILSAFDDFEKIADICEKYGLWMNVDAIWGGPIIFSSKYSHLMKGANRANSVNFAPQKLLSVTLQCSFILVRDKEEAGKTLSASADYLFGSNKCYDVAYDIGDKKFQCGAKCDSFKLWLMFKARGMRDISSAIDNSIDCAKYMIDVMKQRDDFRPVIDEFEFSNACFWYIPQHLRGQPEDEAWWREVYAVVPKIKARLLLDGRVTTNFSVLRQRNVGTFFRLSLMTYPRPSHADMDAIIREIARVGEELCARKID